MCLHGGKALVKSADRQKGGLRASEASLGLLAHHKGQIKAVFSPKVGN